VGSARRLKVGPPPAFEESVTELRPGVLIRYQISAGRLVTSVVTDHQGVMRFFPTSSGGPRLHYEIVFGAKVPGLAALAARVLQGRIVDALPAVDARPPASGTSS
jgi:hypothetical protein